MLYPPSLPESIHARAFRARNGELGIALGDADSFLDACDADRVEVLGWELWLIDHRWNSASGEPALATSEWCGLIQIEGRTEPAVFQGSGNREQTRKEIGRLDLDGIASRWRDCLRINFTVDA